MGVRWTSFQFLGLWEMKIYIRIVCVLLLVWGIFILSGCGSEISPTPSDIPCPPENTSESADSQPPRILYVFLVQEHPRVSSEIDGVYEIITEDTKNFLNPGDRLIMLSMESSTLDAAIFFDETVPYMERPLIEPTPTYYPTITPLPTLEAKPTAGAAIAAERVRQERHSEAEETWNEKSAFEFECSMKSWRLRNQEIWKKYDSDKKKTISDFEDDISDVVEKHIENRKPESRAQIFEAISLSSTIFYSECSYYDKCNLIIFSDMKDSRSESPFRIDLTNVDVTVLLSGCRFISATCEDNIAFWKNEFSSYSVNSSEFFQISKTDEVLKNLRR
jgi:hypothetical protein